MNIAAFLVSCLNLNFYLLISPIAIKINPEDPQFMCYSNPYQLVGVIVFTSFASVLPILNNVSFTVTYAGSRENDPTLYFELAMFFLQFLVTCTLPACLWFKRHEVVALCNMVSSISRKFQEKNFICAKLQVTLIYAVFMLFSAYCAFIMEEYFVLASCDLTEKTINFSVNAYVCPAFEGIQTQGFTGVVRLRLVVILMVLFIYFLFFYYILTTFALGHLLWVVVQIVFKLSKRFEYSRRDYYKQNKVSITDEERDGRIDTKLLHLYTLTKNISGIVSNVFGTLLFEYIILSVVSFGRYFGMVFSSTKHTQLVSFYFSVGVSIVLYIQAAEIHSVVLKTYCNGSDVL